MSATLRGVEAIPVTVEVSVTYGLPGTTIVGMADAAIHEARERVRSAIQAAGFVMPTEKIVINLAPGSMKKTGSGFDLPIALGILGATGQIDKHLLEDKLFVGELSLEGPVRKVLGLLAFGICAKKLGYALVSAGTEVLPITDLPQLRLGSVADLHSDDPFVKALQESAMYEENAPLAPDFRDIAGHEVAKRAMQIAAAGKHGLLMMGPPGSGKTMLASRMVSILPELTQDEMLSAAVVHSVAGEDTTDIIAGIRPFRHPHHSATNAGLIGGGSPIRPGEVSLAHCGVLFLDELAEFKASTLQCLRQPMESGSVSITRADGNIEFPADFMLLAASNPCPCGYYGDSSHVCTCTQGQINAYMGKIGGPLMDRIDLQLDIERLSAQSVMQSGTGLDSATMRAKVKDARGFAAELEKSGVVGSSATKFASPAQVIASCALDNAAREFVESMAEAYSLSGRGLVSLLKVSRTIADLEQSTTVKDIHVAEALGFRLRSRQAG
jgi:magnesium chelatase family protein